MTDEQRALADEVRGAEARLNEAVTRAAKKGLHYGPEIVPMYVEGVVGVVGYVLMRPESRDENIRRAIEGQDL